MRKRLVMFISVLVVSDATLMSDVHDWNSFKAEHSKHYDSLADEIHHFRIFVEHKHQIDEHNLHYENGIAHFKMGLNKYSDLRPEDFIDMMNGIKAGTNVIDEDEESIPFAGPTDVNLPKSVDWRTKGAVTGVKDQGFCGSCWSFSTTGAVEGQHFLKTGHLLSLSEQNLVDCSKSYANYGCRGGWPESAIKYIRDHGIQTEESYPYHGYENVYCQSTVKPSNVIVHGFSRIPSGNEDELQKALAIHGPISVSVDAKHPSFQHYSSGVYHELNCGSRILDLSHAVLLVGYGTDEHDRDYYILKNSWGPSWGEHGYFRMSRNQMNHCGIATSAVFPIL
ncbi:procathepsin L-like [Sitodiplosis mosellana]|uniref:procathepsin L-like n=1 Tax=Sitodiplosis mosellana TaxID=263140 RepID=UPI0024438857|nr:procathepsin L-like [Sitodiplosis mosellana]